jgi:hypothetical protein
MRAFFTIERRKTMAKPKQSGPVETYRVLQPLRHNLKHYVVGETVELAKEDAKPLLGLKVVEAIKAD